MSVTRAILNHLLIEPVEAFEVCLLAVECLRPKEALPAQALTKNRIAEKPVDPVGEGDLVEDVDEKASFTVDAPVLDPADPRADDRRHVRERLDADKAERLLRNLARRLEHEAPGVAGSILEGLDEILTVIRLGLPHQLRRSLACTNAIENALGTVEPSVATSSAGAMPRWRSDGPHRPQRSAKDLPPAQGLPAASCAQKSLGGQNEKGQR